MNEWENEPNELDGEHCGLPVYIRRTEHTGALCGYVGVPSDHPWYGKSYSDAVKVPQSVIDRDIDIDRISSISLLCSSVNSDVENNLLSIDLAISVHGGLTYSDNSKPCHDPDGLWWFGFDCSHAGDLAPQMDHRYPMGGIYRNIEYVKKECESLAEQLEAISKAG